MMMMLYLIFFVIFISYIMLVVLLNYIENWFWFWFEATSGDLNWRINCLHDFCLYLIFIHPYIFTNRSINQYPLSLIPTQNTLPPSPQLYRLPWVNNDVPHLAGRLSVLVLYAKVYQQNSFWVKSYFYSYRAYRVQYWK